MIVIIMIALVLGTTTTAEAKTFPAQATATATPTPSPTPKETLTGDFILDWIRPNLGGLLALLGVLIAQGITYSNFNKQFRASQQQANQAQRAAALDRLKDRYGNEIDGFFAALRLKPPNYRSLQERIDRDVVFTQLFHLSPGIEEPLRDAIRKQEQEKIEKLINHLLN
ncbi:MAG: hypothetical protein M3441_21350 [Chloroflexota bacterium]|nr:hypothetical protein [Chloroflexota bacterium]